MILYLYHNEDRIEFDRMCAPHNMCCKCKSCNDKKFLLAKLAAPVTLYSYKTLCLLYLIASLTALRFQKDNRGENTSFNGLIFASYVVMLFVTIVQLMYMRAHEQSKVSDKTMIRMTRITQSCAITVSIFMCAIGLWIFYHCPLQSTSSYTLLNCTQINISNLPEYQFHVSARMSVVMYGISTLQAAHLLFHMIPILEMILPITLVSGGALAYIGSKFYMTWYMIFNALLYPTLSLSVILIIGWRSVRQLRQIRLDQQLHTSDKDEWMARVGHNIGTPLTSIGLAVKILETHANKEEQKTLDMIQVATDYIRIIYTTLMNNRRGKTTTNARGFSANGFFKKCEAIAMAYGQCKPGVRLVFSTANNVPKVITADYGQLQQCVVNLVSNAMKFTKNGDVEVRMFMTGGRLRISVRDSGPGISKKIEASLFKPGLGLGLVSVAHFVECMGGSYHAQNNVSGHGSTFYVEIPIKGTTVDIYQDDHSPSIFPPPTAFIRDIELATIPEESKIPAGKDNHGIKEEGIKDENAGEVLLVEDNDFNRACVKSLLENRYHLNVTEAIHGKEALIALATGTHFDLVLMDLMMPVMGGYDCFEEIIRIYGDKRPVVWALTASTSKAQRSSWSHTFDEWHDKTQTNDMLLAIAKHFGLVDINNTLSRNNR